MKQPVRPLGSRAVFFLAVWFSSIRPAITIHMAAIICIIFAATYSGAQDVSRFEIGPAFSALHSTYSSDLAAGVNGVYNFGRFFSLEGTFNWFPTNISDTNFIQGQFGGKAGYRTRHFGFFGKVRPGFLSFDNVLREEILTAVVPPPGFSVSIRSGRLTEKTLDLGGVFEYYAAKHWSFRYDMGDTLLFEELPKITINGSPFIPVDSNLNLHRTTNHFQFSTGVHYRF